MEEKHKIQGTTKSWALRLGVSTSYFVALAEQTALAVVQLYRNWHMFMLQVG